MSARRKNGFSCRGKGRIASAALVLITACLSMAILQPLLHAEEKRHDPWAAGKIPGPDRTLTLDGSYVHNIGELQMNVTNWGFFGSLPGSHYPMAESPSAQWPSGSGVEYPYAAGIWGGAMEPIYTPQLLVQAIVVALVAGVVGGLYPAWRATRMRPVEALRYE